MTKVITFSPNPALDISAHISRLVPSEKLRATSVRREPGGGGINVARAIHRLGGDALAVYAAGGGSGNELADLLDREGLNHRPVRVSGHTRESFNVVEDRLGEQYRFVLPGEPMSQAEGNSCIAAAISALESGAHLVGSGSLPPGLPVEFYALAARAAKAKGASVTIDTHGLPLRAALDEGVSIVKTSAREMSDYLGATPSDIAAWRDALRALLQSGKAEMIITTFGAEGAVLVSAGSAWRAEVPQVRPSTTVGAGDSFLGGFLVRLFDGATPDEALRYAAACGTAALLSSGTGLCDRADADRLNSLVTITKV